MIDAKSGGHEDPLRPGASPRDLTQRPFEMPIARIVLIASISVVVGVALSYYSQRPGGVALLRGEAVAVPQVTTPNDEAIPAAQVRFEWRPTTETTRIVVVDLGKPEKPVIDRELPGEQYTPTAEEKALFVAGRKYHWYVEAKGRDGRSRSSAAAQFEVR